MVLVPSEEKKADTKKLSKWNWILFWENTEPVRSNVSSPTHWGYKVRGKRLEYDLMSPENEEITHVQSLVPVATSCQEGP